MIVIKVELWPGGAKARAREIRRMFIANDGTGHQKRGNYSIAIFRRGSKVKVQRRGRVENYPREAYSVWRLVRLAIEAAGV